ncbi:MAG TPA: tRNA adenosine(34) deaminase TadA [Bacilli bacterium]|jgi:tRNA(adenine34) deaminase|nr:nucleoside deaminase [Erysipelotrichaceae bacterium]HOA10883.1 tRNA adenosine(34) deaminase TadA [Bacilli bacterium]HOE53697.1 tRNA adenosine(34) deaminase TadA [Bacilli bacterium]HOH94554.1 tRNA adenosine(34) deaminase TadA [Bacilli bacterium]HOQ70316.1 tRNA adenosine(34) deaminase TadA [Bacilli bacterium]
MNKDEKYMKLALKEAHKAAAIDEVPVGAVIVLNDKVIARGFNKREINNDPLGHAEMIAIRKASKKLNNWRLVDCELYVTVEPCAMCAGAIMWSRLKRVVYGTGDPKGGAMGEAFNLFDERIVNHIPEIKGGVLAKECKEVIQSFFRNKRKI